MSGPIFLKLGFMLGKCMKNYLLSKTLPIINVEFHIHSNWVRKKLDKEVTEVLQQEWSCDHAEGAYTIH
jgi:hypothetical protein